MLRKRLFVAPELLCVFMVGIGLASLSGCRICCEPDDGAYSAYGGAWQRTNRSSGRVGSLINNAGAKALALSDRDAPVSPDELERQRRRAAGSDDALEPDKDSSDDSGDVDVDEKSEAERLEERRRELENQGLEDIKIIPGPAIPPSIH